MSAFQETAQSSRPRSPQRGPSPSLLQTTRGRLNDSQALYDHRMQKIREASYTAPAIGDYEPSKSLMTTTEARKHDTEAWQEHQHEIEAANAKPAYAGRNFASPSKRLLSTTANREHDSQALTDKRAAEDLANFVPYLHSKFVPTASMLQTTESRLIDIKELEERKRRHSEPAYTAPKVAHPVAVSERLLEPTQSNISAIKAWEEEKEHAKYADDIWWELRKPAVAATYKGEVHSKVSEPTECFKQSMRTKLVHSSSQSPCDSATSSPARPIAGDSHLLKATHASVQATWRATSHDSENDIAELGVLHLEAAEAYDHDHHVTSRLHNDTMAARQQRYLAQHQPVKVTRLSSSLVAVSPHLLKATAATVASSREKAHPKPLTDREAGFNLHVTKEHVMEANPFDEPSFLSTSVKRASSPVKTVVHEVKVVTETDLKKIPSKMDMMLAMMHSPLTKINNAALMDDDDTIVVQGEAEDRDIGMRDFNDDTMSQIEVDVQ